MAINSVLPPNPEEKHRRSEPYLDSNIRREQLLLGVFLCIVLFERIELPSREIPQATIGQTNLNAE